MPACQSHVVPTFRAIQSQHKVGESSLKGVTVLPISKYLMLLYHEFQGQWADQWGPSLDHGVQTITSMEYDHRTAYSRPQGTGAFICITYEQALFGMDEWANEADGHLGSWKSQVNVVFFCQ